MIGRLLVDGSGDLPAVHALQDGMCLRRLEEDSRAAGQARRRFDAGFARAELADTNPRGERFAQVVNAALAQNPPPPGERAMVASFAACGIGAGLEPDAEQCELLDTALAVELRAWQQADFGTSGPTGWQMAPLLHESFGEDWLHRAHVALKYIGVLDSREAIYPMLHADADGRPLQGLQMRRLRFAPGALPPVDAFWSLTLYDADSCMLVANPIDRYAIGDRTPGLQPDPDGGLTIHIGHAPPNGAAAAANWLPAPPGRYYLCLRAYRPRAEMLSGRYQLPPLLDNNTGDIS